MVNMDGIQNVIFMCIITILYLSAIGLCRTVIFANHLHLQQGPLDYISIGIFCSIFLVGPFILPKTLYFIGKFTYKSIFLITAIANVLSMTLFVVTVEQNVEQTLIVVAVIIFELIASPFQAIFYCTFNFYIKALSEDNKKDGKNNIGTLFGVAYSMFCMQNLLGAVYMTFAEEITEKNQLFYYPLLAFCFLASLLYLLIKEPSQIKENKQISINLEQKLLKSMYGSLDESMQEVDLSYSTQFKQIWLLPKNQPYFKYHVLNIIEVGLISAFILAFSYQMMQYQNPTLNVVYHSTGQFFGGIVVGLLSDMFGQIRILYIVQLVILIMFIQAFVIEDYLTIDFERILKIGWNNSFQFIAGLIESAYLCITYSICAEQFKESDHALIFCNWAYCISFCLFTLLFEFLQGENQKFNSIAAQCSIFFIFLFTFSNILSIWLYRRQQKLK